MILASTTSTLLFVAAHYPASYTLFARLIGSQEQGPSTHDLICHHDQCAHLLTIRLSKRSFSSSPYYRLHGWGTCNGLQWTREPFLRYADHTSLF
jgi:hypothetical protein